MEAQKNDLLLLTYLFQMLHLHINLPLCCAHACAIITPDSVGLHRSQRLQSLVSLPLSSLVEVAEHWYQLLWNPAQAHTWLPMACGCTLTDSCFLRKKIYLWTSYTFQHNKCLASAADVCFYFFDNVKEGGVLFPSFVWAEARCLRFWKPLDQTKWISQFEDWFIVYSGFC